VVQTSSKNSSHQKLTRKTHERTIEHKNSDEETHQVSQEDKEPPPVHVDFEGLTRAYTLYDAGVNHRLAGNYPVALSELKEAQQIFHLHSQQQSPLETYAYFELAKTADDAGSYDLAVHSYMACIDLDPKFTEARLRLARLEAKHGNLQAALREAKAAYSQDPGSAEAHLIVSLLSEKSGLRPEPPVEVPRRTDLEVGKDLSKDSELIRKIPDVDETQPSTMDPKEP
jgi:tetratricopeptide (TPR) repeat protein